MTTQAGGPVSEHPEAFSALPWEIKYLQSIFSTDGLQNILSVYDSVVDKAGSNTVLDKVKPLGNKAHQCCAIVLDAVTRVPNQSDKLKSLIRILTSGSFQTLFRTHDAMSEEQYVLKPEPYRGSIKTVRLQDSSTNPLGATIRQDPPDTEGAPPKIVVARVIVGGAADTSRKIFTGDEILEINGTSVIGSTVDEVVDLMAALDGAVEFKLLSPWNNTIPTISITKPSIDNTMWIRALFDYNPEADDWLPCKEGGLAFKMGSILRIVSRTDPHWWQAMIEGNTSNAVGLIPGKVLQEKRPVEHRKTRSGKQANSYEEVVLCEPHPEVHRPLVIVGPPNVGRNTVKKHLLERFPAFYAGTIPHTTRAPRSGEAHGREYFFVSREEMQKDIEAKKFIEHGEYHGNMYGTSIHAIIKVMQQHKTCILDVMPKALKYLRNDRLQPIIVFLKPPSMNRLRETRGKVLKEEKLAKVMASAAKYEATYGHVFDYTIVNDDVMTAVEELHQIVLQCQAQAQWIPTNWATSQRYGTSDQPDKLSQ